jgi:UDP-N-acetylglucosamine 2-epimerase
MIRLLSVVGARPNFMKIAPLISEFNKFSDVEHCLVPRRNFPKGVGRSVQAGLRSFDMRMPEEINRKLTDTVATLLFVTEQSGIDN